MENDLGQQNISENPQAERNDATLSGTSGNIKRTEKSDSATVSDLTVGAITVLLGPISGAIMAYISLKKLGKENAIYPLITSVVVTIIVSYLLMGPLQNIDVPGFAIQAPLAVLFVMFQTKAVKQWSIENPTVKYRTDIKDVGLVLLGVILYFVIAFIVALFMPTV